MPITIFNEDCIKGAELHFQDESIDLMICDPPFGIKETSFDNLYARKKETILDGYIEAPDDYYSFSLAWLNQAKRVLKKNGSLYIISGWTNLVHILNAFKRIKYISY